MKKFFKKMNPFSNKEQRENISEGMRVQDRIAHVRRKMTKGAADIFRVLKDHAKWGSKQYWGKSEHGKKRQSGLYHKLFKKK